MLKPPADGPSEDNERSFGELASRLVDDAKAYARAEIDLAKAIAADKSRGLVVAAILFGAAFLIAIGAVSALSVAIFVALASKIGPLLGGLVTFLLIGGIAAGIGWLGWTRLKDAL